MVSLTSNAQATPPTATDKPALLYVVLNTSGDLNRFASSQLPLYATLEGGLLTGANQAGQQDLVDAGLSFQVLDPDLRSGTYYLVKTRSSRPTPDYAIYGMVLLNTHDGVLLRMDPSQVNLLGQAGVELRAITLTSKPIPTTHSVDVFPDVIEPNPIIQGMIDQVTETEVYTYDRQLAGELPVWVDNAWYTISSRHTYSGTPIQKTTSFVGQHMADLGLEVEYHTWGGSTYPNVIGEITGLIDPDEIFIIGGHIDDVSGSPGADDNASGSVATLLAADILSQYHWGCTLRFAFWTGEEQGLKGSEVYAERAFNNGENILGYLNLDMIAWNTIGSQPYINLSYLNSIPQSYQLAQLYGNVIDTYRIKLLTRFVNGMWGSDHNSFWDYDFNSILAIEDDVGDDFNPYYHSSADTPAHTDPAYFTNFVKSSIATYAHMSDCLLPDGVGALDGMVTDTETGSPLPGAVVGVEDDQEHDYSDTTNMSGYYTMTLPADTYTVTASLDGYVSSVVTTTVIDGEVVHLNFELQKEICFPVTQTDFNWQPTVPGNGELVTFAGSSNGSEPLIYTWDFGDDITGTGVTVAHTYLHAGSYLVELSATNACGDEIVSKELPIITKIIQFFLPLLHK